MCGRALAPRRRRAGERAGLRWSADCGCGLLRAPSSPRTFPACNDANAFDALSRCALFPRRSARPSCRRSTSTPFHHPIANSPSGIAARIHTARPAPACRLPRARPSLSVTPLLFRDWWRAGQARASCRQRSWIADGTAALVVGCVHHYALPRPLPFRLPILAIFLLALNERRQLVRQPAASNGRQTRQE